MVSHKSLSDNKSPQVSKTLLSILPDLNNAVVWMVSARPPVLIPILWSVLRAPITTSKILNVKYYCVWFSVRNSAICLYQKIIDNFVRPSLLDGFWFVHVPFIGMEYFSISCTIPGDNFPAHSSLLLLFF